MQSDLRRFNPSLAQAFEDLGREVQSSGGGSYGPTLAREYCLISLSVGRGIVARKINRALDSGRRLVAIGTTTVRTLEFAARETGRVAARSGEADLFIYPGFQFRAVGAMLTNFHLPKSTLLMLVSAFAGRERTLAVYGHAVEQKYRFYSYGDCMFIE